MYEMIISVYGDDVLSQFWMGFQVKTRIEPAEDYKGLDYL